MRVFVLLLVAFLGGQVGFNTLTAQTSIRDSVVLAGLVNLEYGAVMPLADLADRFGFHSDLGFNVQIKNRSNTVFGAGADFFFGSQIREDSVVLDALRADNGFLLGTDGFLHQPLLLMRGFSFSAHAGKVIPLKKPNMNSGIILTGGVGFFQHKISIQGENEFLPQLNDELLKGYDRLSNGMFISQYLGFLYLGNAKFINVKAGIEVREALTRSRRNFNYDTGEVPEGNRLDMQVALKVAWVLPIFEKPNVKYYTF